MQKKLKRWLIITISLSLAALILIGGIIVLVDPYFHYHAPLSCFGYIMDNERYQNDGIVKHFDYDAIITGSSMTENFKTSDLNALFNVNAIKVPFSGGSFKEVNELLKTALKTNPNVKMIVRGLDYDRFFDEPDHRDYDSYPDYLYDNNPFNDVSYLFNSEVLFVALQDIIGRDANGKLEINFDTYVSWKNTLAFGKDAVDYGYNRNAIERTDIAEHVSDEEFLTIKQNIEENVLSLVKEYPNTEFYLYFPPFSIAYMDNIKLQGKLEKQLEAEKYIVEMLLPYGNVKIYSFILEDNLITNIDNYRDIGHHSAEINTQILKWMKEGEGLLTEENYLDYLSREHKFLTEFDYETYFADWN